VAQLSSTFRWPALVYRRVGSTDMVISQDVREPQLLDASGVGPQNTDIAADLSLGKDDTDLHGICLARPAR
jgi:hypothetical protein